MAANLPLVILMAFSLSACVSMRTQVPPDVQLFAETVTLLAERDAGIVVDPRVLADQSEGPFWPAVPKPQWLDQDTSERKRVLADLNVALGKLDEYIRCPGFMIPPGAIDAEEIRERCPPNQIRVAALDDPQQTAEGTWVVHVLRRTLDPRGSSTSLHRYTYVRSGSTGEFAFRDSEMVYIAE